MPTLRELQDVLDWKAVTVLKAIDEQEGATLETVVDETEFEWDLAENRCEQLVAVGLIDDPEADGETVYELTGAGHGAVGAGLYDEFDLDREDIDALAERFAELLDRRDDLQAAVADLRDDAERLEAEADSQFADRDDVDQEVQSLLADIEQLEAALSEE